MKHTPGPWYAIGRMVEVGDDDHADICSTNPDLFGQGHRAPPIEEQQANARLIAAAPDLLEALEAMVEHFATPTSERSAASYGKTKAQVADEARAAIAAAK